MEKQGREPMPRCVAAVEGLLEESKLTPDGLKCLKH